MAMLRLRRFSGSLKKALKASEVCFLAAAVPLAFLIAATLCARSIGSRWIIFILLLNSPVLALRLLRERLIFSPTSGGGDWYTRVDFFFLSSFMSKLSTSSSSFTLTGEIERAFSHGLSSIDSSHTTQSPKH
uniref:Uncharacterized protein MANES_01G189400 n=1 Tax=Rhizophora mucronata TaxID=61149 RepID=A0A2P2KQ75_RHIMU